MTPGDVQGALPLSVVRIADDGTRIEAVVRVSAPGYMRTSVTPGVADRILERYPGLIRHRCQCGSARGIAAELRNTETPHLLEHLTLELMVLAGAPRSLSGLTRWDFKRDGRGVFRVSIAYTDPEHDFSDADLARRSLHDALAVVNEVLVDAVGRQTPD